MHVTGETLPSPLQPPQVPHGLMPWDWTWTYTIRHKYADCVQKGCTYFSSAAPLCPTCNQDQKSTNAENDYLFISMLKLDFLSAVASVIFFVCPTM